MITCSSKEFVMLRGSCFCKAVQYESHGRILRFFNCHCPDCRKLSGAAFASFLSVEADGFRIVAGEEKLHPYQSSPGKARNFCGVCGTHLFRRVEGTPGSVLIRAGTLDDDPGIRPSVDIWVSLKAPWHDIPAGAQQFDQGFIPSKI
jgi:hypothetical protein